jgi:hypothetical protein
LIEKLAALVPRPRYHIVHLRCLCPRREMEKGYREDPQPAKNYTWAQLMARTFEFDVLQCPRCGGRMKIIAAIESPEVARRILDCLGIVSRPPSLLPARRQIVQLDSAEADFLV